MAFGIGPVYADAVAPQRQGPCDIVAKAGTPCVAAHSLTRALFGHYSGPLYRIQRRNKAERDIGTTGPENLADASAQEAFCGKERCVITRIYDQTAKHNDLTIEGPGENGGQDRGAIADALPVTLNGHRVYGLLIEAGMGYRNNETRGIAENGQPETMLMVTSPRHANDGCCFDYGNAERNSKDTGEGHMDALYFGTNCVFRKCIGKGPWVQADLENGLYITPEGSDQGTNYRGDKSPFVTALLKNDGQTFFGLKSGDAQRGRLSVTYQGPLPTSKPGYYPMHQEGAIVLGTGGDNSNQSTGSFFEGFMTAGVMSDATDDAVQANIVAAGYGGLR